ncbi:MAG TPA: 16S rRNA (adenine(1518)-N(6)/adenine(1519)-N(6))-dimethyltransferase RsmA [Bacteroidales bacterium]|nr:16S rRNA (adenine(1518)-N(6)/adenine(1519)-N(6))-dimethyltransferase RsmA [Bacteroidales bacterium]HPS62947.1 16S rRNA (adenine(1518)-N(6)/adenine(1519)-N(6))-dimethyltransferase RsmA [Bacteroidales bacterium]
MVRPKKHLGQHFLRDDNIARKITGCLNPELPLVLEIGPGMGVLSRYILDDSRFDPWFIEVDRESVDYLGNTFPSISGRILPFDFLRYDLSAFPPGHGDPQHAPPFSIIGNFPYNISSQILFRVIDNRDRIPEVVGMFQKEVAERIASPPGSKSYGILSVLLQAWYDIEYLFTVEPAVFHPPPKVRSAVIRLRRNATTALDCDEALFKETVKTAFNQRRKTLRNALRRIYPPAMPEPATHTGWLGDVLEMRAERLSVADFVRLTAEISTFA